MNEPQPSAGDSAAGTLIATATEAPGDAATRSAMPPQRRPAPMRDIFVSFQSRDFRFLCLSSLALGFGQWAQQVGLPWLALELTGSAKQIGGVAAVQSGVGLVVAPIAGYLADRYPRRLVIVWSTAASAVQAAVLAALAVSGAMQVWQLYALALAGGALQAFAQPARQSFVYDLTTDETLVNAVTMNSLIQNFARIAGPPIAGAMIGFWGVGAAFMFLAAMKVVAVVLTIFISSRTRQVRMASGRNPISGVLEGFRATWEDRRVLGLVIVHAIPSLLVIPYLPYLSFIARNVLHGGASLFGLLTSMVGWGAVCGLFGLALLRDPKHKGLLMLACFTVYAAALGVVAISHVLVLTMAMLVVVGMVNSVAFALNNTLIQLAAPHDARGRVMSVWQLSSGVQPLGALTMGVMIDHYGVPLGMGSFMAVATVAFMLFTFAWASVRRM
ncbi:MAG: MFS transporter [Dehalococcoidia bacterium]|nr:MFS transporter [Dehalococcoidia bacterium]